MSRTTRQKTQYNKPATVGADGPVWRDSSDPYWIERREKHLNELEARGCNETRVRRGKVVAIPARWQGQVTGNQTKARRRVVARNKVKDRKRKKISEAKAHLETQVSETQES